MSGRENSRLWERFRDLSFLQSHSTSVERPEQRRRGRRGEDEREEGGGERRRGRKGEEEGEEEGRGGGGGRERRRGRNGGEGGREEGEEGRRKGKQGDGGGMRKIRMITFHSYHTSEVYTYNENHNITHKNKAYIRCLPGLLRFWVSVGPPGR